MQAVPSLEKPVPTPQHRLEYGTLSPTFISALKQWKTQTMSFLDLPGEIRNHIYNLHIPEPSEHYTDLRDLDHRRHGSLPHVALMFMCTEMQREILPMYLRTINLRLNFDDRVYLQGCNKFLYMSPLSLTTLDLYAGLDPTVAEHLRSLRLDTDFVYCNIQVNDLRAVHVELLAYGDWISPEALTSMSMAIRNKVIHSLVNSPTGFLGVRHFRIAEKEIDELREGERSLFRFQKPSKDVISIMNVRLGVTTGMQNRCSNGVVGTKSRERTTIQRTIYVLRRCV